MEIRDDGYYILTEEEKERMIQKARGRSLAEKNPELAKQWNYEKNGDLRPEMVTVGSGRKAWWICEYGHEWQASIGSRNNGSGCPQCSSNKKTSFPEFVLYYYLRMVDKTVIHCYKDLGFELDIYIPSKKIGIEYDGKYWHQNKFEIDLKKNKRCADLGITLYRIRELLPSLNDTSIDIICNTKNLDMIVRDLVFSIYGEIVDVNFRRDCILINDLRILSERQDSLAVKNSEVASEWHPTKNKKTNPSNVSCFSHMSVWWFGKCGHEWRARIDHRHNGAGCPYCSGRNVISGETDLETISPQIAKQWHPTKNGDRTPNNITAKNKCKAWWICEFGHEWESSIGARVDGTGCPYCSGRNAISGENDLATTNPELASDWHQTKNGELKPTDVLAGSGKRVWWLGKCGHEWEASIRERINGTQCPICANRVVLAGYNDLQSRFPEIAAEWHPTKNNDLTPNNIVYGSNKDVWWMCGKGHEWHTSIVKRTARGHGCPYCSGRRKLSPDDIII